MPAALLIGHVDSTGEFGVTSDMVRLEAKGVTGRVAVTALIASKEGAVRRCHPVPPVMVGEMIDSAVKAGAINACRIGMLRRRATAAIVAGRLHRRRIPSVVADIPLRDPLGRGLLESKSLFLLRHRLYPLCDAVLLIPSELPLVLGGVSSHDSSGSAVDEMAARIMERGPRSLLLLEGIGERDRAVRLSFYLGGKAPRRFNEIAAPDSDKASLRDRFSLALLACLTAGSTLSESVESAYHEAGCICSG